MDLIDKVRAIASRVPSQIEHLQTEEATKMALIVPFLAALDWDVYNPLEVVPEYTADVGTKRGEKVDYAIMRGGSPIILVEAKKVGVNLDKEPASQLFRYFSVTDARLGILTDGVQYKFYSDLEKPNKMDEKPFFEFSMLDFTDGQAGELKRFTKAQFDVDLMLSAAVELKYTRAIKQMLRAEMKGPSEDFIRYCVGKVYSGRMSKTVREQFEGITKRALVGFVNEVVEARLKHVLTEDPVTEETAADGPAGDPTDEVPVTPQLPAGVVALDGEVITTQEEVDAYNIVRAIVAEVIDPERVFMRDTKSYCGILVDNNNRKPICRLRFNAKRQKYLGLLDAEKREERVSLEEVKDLYGHAEALRTAAQRYSD